MAQSVPAEVGASLEEILTPALIVELDAFERNLERMQAVMATHKVRCRPHAKTHKCSQIARMQLARGAIGVCCQTVGEAEVMAAAGIPDILVTNQIIEEGKIARAMHLSARARIGLCVDAVEKIQMIAAIAARQGVTADIYVEIDVDSQRCGVPPGRAAVDLAITAGNFNSLRFAGLQCYNGKIQAIRNYAERRAAAERVAMLVSDTVAQLRARDVNCPILTGGGTGTFEMDIAAGAINEVQPGSYIFSDADYAQIETGTRFENSLFVLTRVISRPTSRLAIVNAGLKALTFDHGLPVVVDEALVRYYGPNDEHGRLEFPIDAPAPPVGTLVTLIPGHCDPAVNLYDWIVGVRHRRVEVVWPIEARGAF